MKIGYIHTNHEEQTKALQVLKMLTESVALDEIGIGRIRDAFSNKMFPGISTLQKHAKYFSLMPQLYRKATERCYNRPSEVSAEIVRLERIMTRNLYDASEDKRGITGSEMIGKNRKSYVKYDPAYIYNSGLQAFEILRSPQLYELIYATSKKLHAALVRYKSLEDDGNPADDAEGGSGLYQFCSFPNVDYDFTQGCSLTLTREDKQFITEHILTAQGCKDSLLRFVVENEDLPLSNDFPGIDSRLLPKDLAAIQQAASDFADFIYLVHLRYNWIYSKQTDEKILDEFERKLKEYKQSGTDINAVLQMVDVRDNGSKIFCRQTAEEMARADYDALDHTIEQRERRVKGTRRKIGNPSYEYDPKNPIHHYKLTFRWETVKTFADELRKEATNG